MHAEVTFATVPPMRTVHRCPKCNHGEILFIPQIADRDDADKIRPLVAHVVEYGWRDDAEFGQIQAYICRGCGFTELYTKDAKALPVEKIPGAKLLKAK
jgi:predicted nucleic-acid-binding Zn-ribbon protein